MERLDVYLCDRLVGALERTERGMTFRYLPDYLSAPSPHVISSTLPLSDRVYEERDVMAFFSNLLPDDAVHAHHQARNRAVSGVCLQRVLLHAPFVPFITTSAKAFTLESVRLSDSGLRGRPLQAVVAKSIERIHRANLINFGIVPFTFLDSKDYDKLSAGDKHRYLRASILPE